MIYTVIDPSGNACNSHVPYGGYSYETLRDMADNGYTLQIDGKDTKFPTKAEYSKVTSATKIKSGG